MKIKLLVLLLCLSAHAVEVAPPPEVPSNGFIIHYRKGTPAKELDEFHAQAGFALRERFKKWNADWLVPRGKKPFLTIVTIAKICAL